MKWLQSDQNPLGHPLAVLLNGYFIIELTLLERLVFRHPDDGIGPCEDNYTTFAKAIGADPSVHAKFSCNMSNESWVHALFTSMLDPKGVDYWWTGGWN